MTTSDLETYHFVYEGIEYDITDFIPRHPGGKQIIDNMKQERKDITEHFKSLHSKEAEKMLKSMPIISRNQMSFNSKQYLELLAKVEHLYNVRWDYEIALIVFFGGLFFLGCFTHNPSLSVLCFMVSQIVAGWMGHSSGHSGNRHMKFIGKIFLGIFGGFSMNWWSRKHNSHHMFTNSKIYDDDINHEYDTKLVYPLLYLKWNYDSIVEVIHTKDYVEILCLAIRYGSLYLGRANFLYYLVATLVGGFYSAMVLVGNHERETKFDGKTPDSFVDHQLMVCRNYWHVNFFWLVMMGGMQFQAEHHIFPQIPFYNLPEASHILRDEFKKINKSVILGPVF